MDFTDQPYNQKEFDDVVNWGVVNAPGVGSDNNNSNKSTGDNRTSQFQQMGLAMSQSQYNVQQQLNRIISTENYSNNIMNDYTNINMLDSNMINQILVNNSNSNPNNNREFNQKSIYSNSNHNGQFQSVTENVDFVNPFSSNGQTLSSTSFNNPFGDVSNNNNNTLGNSSNAGNNMMSADGLDLNDSVNNNNVINSSNQATIFSDNVFNDNLGSNLLKPENDLDQNFENNHLSIPYSGNLNRQSSSSNLSDLSSYAASPAPFPSAPGSPYYNFDDSGSINDQGNEMINELAISNMYLDNNFNETNMNQNIPNVILSSGQLTSENLETFRQSSNASVKLENNYNNNIDRNSNEPSLLDNSNEVNNIKVEIDESLGLGGNYGNNLLPSVNVTNNDGHIRNISVSDDQGSNLSGISANNFTSPVSPATTGNTPSEDLLHPDATRVGRSKSKKTQSKSPSRSRSRSKSRERNLALPENRDKILELASPNHSNKRQQKHPSIYACDLCDKKFTRPYNLKSHKRTHTDERPFICSTCGKAFARQHDKKRHEDLHTGEKRFQCRGFLKDGTTTWGCGKKFARVDALGRHFRTEAGKECIKPLVLEAESEKNSVIINEEFCQQILRREQQRQESQKQAENSNKINNNQLLVPNIQVDTSSFDMYSPGVSPIDSPIPEFEISGPPDN